MMDSIKTRIADRAQQDEGYRARLLEEPGRVLEEEAGIRIPEGVAVEVREEPDGSLAVVWPLGAQPHPPHSADRTSDEAAIREIVAAIADAWTAGDGEAFAAAFAADADYTVWNGMYSKGREAIAKGHQHIFATFYKGTKLRTTVRSIRFLRPDVALVHAEGSIVKHEEEFPDAPGTVPLLVLTKEQGTWGIAAFQNTPRMAEQAGPPPGTRE